MIKMSSAFLSDRWRPLRGFEGRYEVSDAGEIRRVGADKPRKFKPDHRGYLRCAMPRNDGRSCLVSMHVAVLEAFVGLRPAGCDASHVNGIRTDNRLENLCWESSKENHARKWNHGTMICGEKHKLAKLCADDVRAIRRRYAAGDGSCHSLGREYGVSGARVSQIVRGIAWPHVGVAA